MKYKFLKALNKFWGKEDGAEFKLFSFCEKLATSLYFVALFYEDDPEMSEVVHRIRTDLENGINASLNLKH
jgi:hypothetical protein